MGAQRRNIRRNESVKALYTGQEFGFHPQDDGKALKHDVLRHA